VCVCVCVSNEKNQCEWLETYYTWSPITVHATYKHIMSKKVLHGGVFIGDAKTASIFFGNGRKNAHILRDMCCEASAAEYVN